MALLPCPGAAPVELWVVHAREEHPPADSEPLEWFLLTTLPVNQAEDARRILHYYTLRWRIEDYFRILKSGCKVEELQHHTAERLERAIAIKMVVGWRIQLMLRLGREMPELPPELLFSDIELRVLATFAARASSNRPRISARPFNWSRTSAAGSVTHATLRAHNSCGTAMPNSRSWPSAFNYATNSNDLTRMAKPSEHLWGTGRASEAPPQTDGACVGLSQCLRRAPGAVPLRGKKPPL